MTTKELQSIDFYETEAKDYDERRWNTKAGRYNDEIQKGIVIELVGDCEGKKILDIATGTGRFALELAQRGAEMTVLDSSKNMLGITHKKFEVLELLDKLTIKQGLATKLPVSDKSLDICICINAMNHIEGYLKLLLEIHRVLKPGGISVNNYTNWLSPYLPFGVWVNLKKKSVTRNVYTKWFNSLEIVSLYKTCDLDVEAVRGELHCPTWGNNKGLLFFLKAFDRVLRKPPLVYFASQLFVKARKKRKICWQ
jgi:ubiquinone/menaquinone biosynthesis C-methylase UbiE